ncbi:hypothetical protein HDV57DRAFT_294333 [Trichoderma longibrachiatum]
MLGTTRLTKRSLAVATSAMTRWPGQLDAPASLRSRLAVSTSVAVRIPLLPLHLWGGEARASPLGAQHGVHAYLRCVECLRGQGQCIECISRPRPQALLPSDMRRRCCFRLWRGVRSTLPRTARTLNPRLTWIIGPRLRWFLPLSLRAKVSVVTCGQIVNRLQGRRGPRSWAPAEVALC